MKFKKILKKRRRRKFKEKDFNIKIKLRISRVHKTKFNTKISHQNVIRFCGTKSLKVVDRKVENFHEMF